MTEIFSSWFVSRDNFNKTQGETRSLNFGSPDIHSKFGNEISCSEDPHSLTIVRSQF